MLVMVVACLLVFGATIWSVLDRPFSRRPGRNAVASAVLLGMSGTAVLAGVVTALIVRW